MAVTPDPIVLRDDLFLLNRGSTTYKLTATDLADNILNIVLTKPDGSPDSKIFINDLGDASTLKYVADYDTGALASFATDKEYQSFTYSGESEVPNWMLQFNPTAGEFVLTDPSKGLDQAISLNDLGDVTISGKAAGNILVDLNGDGTYTNVHVSTVLGTFGLVYDMVDTTFAVYTTNDYVADDTIIVATGAKATRPAGDTGADAPQWKNAKLSDILKKNSDEGTLPITLEGLKNVVARVQITTAFKNAPVDPLLNNTKKYEQATTETALVDDMIVYVKASNIEGKVKPFLGTGLVGAEVDATDGYYLISAKEAPAAGGDLEIAGLTDSELAALADGEEQLNTVIDLGGVRVAKYKDTVVNIAKGADYGKVTAAPKAIPSNIGITDSGILYSEIPSVLTFKGTLLVENDGSNGAADTQKYNAAQDGTGGVAVNATGPGDLRNDDITDGTPLVGDFYVIDFQKDITATEASIKWNTALDTANGTSGGSDLTVRKGALVAWGGTYWNVIGEISTDNIAQDLQSVTTEGNTTTKGIELLKTDDAGLLVGAPAKGYEADGVTSTGDATMAEATAGKLLTETIGFNNIDFNMIKPLPS